MRFDKVKNCWVFEGEEDNQEPELGAPPKRTPVAASTPSAENAAPS